MSEVQPPAESADEFTDDPAKMLDSISKLMDQCARQKEELDQAHDDLDTFYVPRDRGGLPLSVPGRILLLAKLRSPSIPTEPVMVTRCDDGKWMVHTEGDIIAMAGQGDEEKKARRIAAALNAQVRSQPESGLTVTLTSEQIIGGIRFDPGAYRIQRIVGDALEAAGF